MNRFCFVLLILTATLMILSGPQVLAGDWPTLQHDVQRTGVTPELLGPAPTYEITIPTGNVSPVHWFHQAMVADDVIYFCDGRTLFAIEVPTWLVLWTFNDPNRDLRVPAVDNGAVYVNAANGSDGMIYSLNATTGSVIWNHAIAAEPDPVAAGNGLVYFGYSTYWSGPFGIRALDAATGATVWDHPDSSHGFGPAVLSEDQTRLVAARQNLVFCFDALTGSVIWTYDAGAYWQVRVPIVKDNVVYAYYGGVSGSWAFALDLNSGSEIWRVTLPWPGVCGQAGAVFDGKFYLCLGDELRALDCSNGSTVWTFPLGTGTTNNAPIVTGAGAIFFTSGKTLYSVDAQTGQYEWEYGLGADALYCIPSVAGGRLYVPNNLGEIFVFSGGPRPPVPDIKINGQDGPLTIPHTQGVRVTLNMEVGDMGGTPMDWWIVARKSGGGMFSWVLTVPSHWVPGVQRAYGGPLVSLTNFPLYTGTIPLGTWTIAFAVDPMDNVFQGTYQDNIVVTSF